jgi:hypothetical protein
MRIPGTSHADSSLVAPAAASPPGQPESSPTFRLSPLEARPDVGLAVPPHLKDEHPLPHLASAPQQPAPRHFIPRDAGHDSRTGDRPVRFERLDDDRR